MSTVRTIACCTLFSKTETHCSSSVDYRKVLKVTATSILNYGPNIVSRNMSNNYITLDQRNLKLEAIQREQKKPLKNQNCVETRLEKLLSRESVAIHPLGKITSRGCP